MPQTLGGFLMIVGIFCLLLSILGKIEFFGIVAEVKGLQRILTLVLGVILVGFSLELYGFIDFIPGVGGIEEGDNPQLY